MISPLLLRRRISDLFYWLWILFLIGGIYFSLQWRDVIQALPYQAYIIQSGSMEKSIPIGSLIIDAKLNPQQYQVGDIVTYLDVGSARQFITHRIIALKENVGGAKLFQSKGDANTNGDMGSKPLGSITGKVILVIPYLGYPISWLRTPLGFMGISFVVTVFLFYVLAFCSSPLVKEQNKFITYED